MEVTLGIVDRIKTFIGEHPAERGGILGCNSNGRITHFFEDVSSECSRAAYSPDVDTLNTVIDSWKGDGITFCGFVHSHPAGIPAPSPADHEYSSRILECFDKLDLLWLPIVQTEPDTGKFEMYVYATVPGNECSIVAGEYEIVDEKATTSLTEPSRGDRHIYQSDAWDFGADPCCREYPARGAHRWGRRRLASG